MTRSKALEVLSKERKIKQEKRLESNTPRVLKELRETATEAEEEHVRKELLVVRHGQRAWLDRMSIEIGSRQRFREQARKMAPKAVILRRQQA